MNHLLSCFLAGVLAASASSAASVPYYALELKGGSRVFSADVPLRKGRVLLFHRYPDGTYMSLAASEVEKSRRPREGEPPKAEKLAPGETVYVGNAVEGPGYEMPEGPPPAPAYGGLYGPRVRVHRVLLGRRRLPAPATAPPRPAAAVPHRAERLSDPRPARNARARFRRRSVRTAIPILAAPPAVASPRGTVAACRRPDGRARGGGGHRLRRLRNDHGRAQAHGHRRDVLPGRRHRARRRNAARSPDRPPALLLGQPRGVPARHRRSLRGASSTARPSTNASAAGTARPSSSTRWASRSSR